MLVHNPSSTFVRQIAASLPEDDFSPRSQLHQSFQGLMRLPRFLTTATGKGLSEGELRPLAFPESGARGCTPTRGAARLPAVTTAWPSTSTSSPGTTRTFCQLWPQAILGPRMLTPLCRPPPQPKTASVWVSISALQFYPF